MPAARINLGEIEDALGSEVRDFLVEVANELVNNLKEEAPVGATGDLRRSLQILQTGEDEIIVGSNLDYALYVQTGTRPHTPPFEPIQIWARRKLGSEEAAGAIFHKISEEGTDSNPYFTRAIERTQRQFR